MSIELEHRIILILAGLPYVPTTKELQEVLIETVETVQQSVAALIEARFIFTEECEGGPILCLAHPVHSRLREIASRLTPEGVLPRNARSGWPQRGPRRWTRST